MNQADLLSAFEADAIDPSKFPHAHHVHVAWALAEKYGRDEGLRRMIDGIRRMTVRAGRPGAFHMTITRAWFDLIATVPELSSAPELLDKSILNRYYSAGRLAEGRDRWLEPDLHALTWPLPPVGAEP